MQEAISGKQLNGAVRAHRIYEPEDGKRCNALVPDIRNGKKTALRLPGMWQRQSEFKKNLVLYEWATIVGELMRNAPDGKPYYPAAIYFEFENNGGAPVTDAPAVSRDVGLSYYTSLGSPKDYLRVPITAVTLTSTDETLFPGGNRLTFFAQTAGTAGVKNSLPFDAPSQSRVFGFALAATPDFGDSAQDKIFSRFYYSDTGDQLVKLTGSQIGVEWRIDLN